MDRVFSQFGCTPPSNSRLCSTLLDDCYNSVKEEVEEVVAASQYLGPVADESTDINSNRIENISIIINKSSYY